MAGELVDRIYEAAFVPELWVDVLDSLSQVSGSIGGVLLVAREREQPRWRASPVLQRAVHAVWSGDHFQDGERPARWRAGHDGFLRDVDAFSMPDLEADPLRRFLERFGLGWEAGTVIHMPTGEVVVYALDRRLADGPHDAGLVSALNAFRPHLARAGLMAARLGLERAASTVSAMAAMGLPAAVLSANGRVLAANAQLEVLSSVFVVRAHGGLALAPEPANALLSAAIADLPGEAAVRSIPVPAAADRPALVVHVVPLRRGAHDIFSGGDVLIAATTVAASALAPPSSILAGLFDLTPAEARLAVAPCEGKSLKQGAAAGGIRFSTARSSLERIFRKTGTHQQSQLVALFKSAQPLGQADR